MVLRILLNAIPYSCNSNFYNETIDPKFKKEEYWGISNSQNHNHISPQKLALISYLFQAVFRVLIEYYRTKDSGFAPLNNLILQDIT